MKRSIVILLVLTMVISLVLTGCSIDDNGGLTASGNLSALDVPIAPEIGGRVIEINVSEGDPVQAGDVLFRVDDEPLQAQRDQAQAAADAADATLEAARAQLLYAQSQLELAVQGARAQDMQARQNAWNAENPDDYRPVWYFQKTELIDAAQAEVDAADAALADEQANLDAELKKAANQDFIAVEERLAQAQIGYTIAQTTFDQAESTNDENLTEAAQDNFDLAQSELDDACLEYERMLSTSAADAVLRARAQVAVAQSRYDNARDALTALQTGDQSIQVNAAEAGVEQAQSAVTQAEANIEQTRASLALIELQLKRTDVKAPIDGVILTRNLEVGEIVAPGGIVMSVAQLEDLDLVVYLPEDRYGQVAVGQQANIKVDSFPGQLFSGSVTRIADEAEFTPRNVQTVEGRTSTVYAVKISVPNDEARLKPGMPADVTFVEEKR
ncbi:MAG: HlyD family efflux transporter periplasmic adaptor subunit [Anaerolineae bacterium]|nr:HlyD family efflux transporter periplasmic adaptor subunit [Anaerolineae bacterium]